MCYWLSVANPSRRGIAARASRGGYGPRKLNLWLRHIAKQKEARLTPSRSSVEMNGTAHLERPVVRDNHPRSKKTSGTRASRGRRAVRDGSWKIAKPCRDAANLVMRPMAGARTESVRSTPWPNQTALITRNRR